MELRLIDGELIGPSMTATARARVKRTLAGLPVVAVDSSIRLTGDDPGPPLRHFLQLASDWESPLVRVFGGALPAAGSERRDRLPGRGPGARGGRAARPAARRRHRDRDPR